MQSKPDNKVNAYQKTQLKGKKGGNYFVFVTSY
jgi:hypothetical protein